MAKAAWNCFALLGVLLMFITSSQAELSPGAYEELKSKATEVLSVNVTKVTNVTATSEDDKCTLYFTVQALVLDVSRSTLGHAQNDVVQFEAYILDRSLEECKLFVGPSPPELLENGWCGLVYLNEGADDSSIMEPAAFGQSFEEYTVQQCEEVASGEWDPPVVEASNTTEPTDATEPPGSSSSGGSLLTVFWSHVIMIAAFFLFQLA